MASDFNATSAFQKFVRSQVIGFLNEHGIASRAQLMELTGLSRSALGGVVDDLKAEDLLYEYESEQRTRSVGRPARVLGLVAANTITLGVDIGPSRVAVGAVDSSGSVLKSAERASALRNGRTATIEVLAELAAQVIAESPGEPTRAVIGLPTMVDSVEQSVDFDGARTLMPTWADGRTIPSLTGALSLPCRIENVAALATLAELRLGAGRQHRTFIWIGVGHEGIGSGLVLNGSLFRGAHGFSGEISHVSIVPDGVICPCGKRGCLAAETANQLRLFLESRSAEMGHGTYAQLADSSRDGDPAVQRLFRDIGWQSGRALGSIANMVDPDAVVVSDSLTHDDDTTLSHELQSALAQHTHPGIYSHMRTTVSDLGGKAVLRGTGLVPPFSGPAAATRSHPALWGLTSPYKIHAGT